MTDQILTIKKKDRSYSLLSMDTTSHCNARCRFCFNDWEKIRPSTMTEETFHKVLGLLPLVPGNGFYLSCLFEPTIYPAFFDFLSQIPKQYQHKVFFTTNLVKPLDDEQINAIVNANIDHINISLETFDSETYTKLTGVKNSHFYENLKKVSSALKGSSVKLRLITMMIDSNQHELIDLVRTAHDELIPFEHEIRTPFPFEASKEQVQLYEQELLPQKTIDSLVSGLQRLGYDNLDISAGWSKEYYHQYRSLKKIQSRPDDDILKKTKYDIRIEADGTVHFGGTDHYFSLSDIKDPLSWFSEKITVLQQEETDRFLASSMPRPRIHIQKDPLPCSLDEATLYDDHFLHLRGWDSLFPDNEEPFEKILMIQTGLHRVFIRAISEQRMDVAKVMNDESLFASGFDTCIKVDHPENLKRARIFAGYRDKNDMFLHRLPVRIQ